MLPGLLASVEGLWDELVVTDTGSSDGTVDLVLDANERVTPGLAIEIRALLAGVVFCRLDGGADTVAQSPNGPDGPGG